MLINIHPFIRLSASPFFRRGIEGVENQQINPLNPPLKKGEAKEKAINGWKLIKERHLFSFCLILTFYMASSPAAELQNSHQDALAHFKPVMSADFKGMLKTADAAAGKEFFMRKCSSCHDEFKSKTHGKGPNLWNVFGRKAGTAEGFEYSDAMKQSGHIWNFSTLNYYLTKTERAVPGRIMNFRGIRQDKYRAKLLIFLSSMNDTPPVLPD